MKDLVRGCDIDYDNVTSDHYPIVMRIHNPHTDFPVVRWPENVRDLRIVHPQPFPHLYGCSFHEWQMAASKCISKVTGVRVPDKTTIRISAYSPKKVQVETEYRRLVRLERAVAHAVRDLSRGNCELWDSRI